MVALHSVHVVRRVSALALVGPAVVRDATASIGDHVTDRHATGSVSPQFYILGIVILIIFTRD